MPRSFFLSLALLLAAPCAVAQVNEVGLTGGVVYYIGDLNPTKHYPTDTKLAGGIVFRHNFTDRLALRLQGLNDTLQQIRNLHFRARLFELSGLLEINFFPYRSKTKESKRWTPFVFGGLAYFRADPQAQLDDTWYRLQPLGTEGQGTSAVGGETYKVDRMSLPFGAGLKFNFGKVDVQVEWGMRRTWTDYIDDVSGTYVDNAVLAAENGPLAAALADRSGLAAVGFNNTGQARGDVNTRDWYQYTGLSITYIISRFSDCDEQYNWMRKRR
jgi:hypothetical protein